MVSFVRFTFFRLQIFTFFVSIYKELLEPTFSGCLTVLDNLCEAFGCSVIIDLIDFISTNFGFSKSFG